MLLYSIFYFACIVIAGRKYWREEQSSFGFLAGAVLGPLGVIIVYYMPSVLSNSFVTNRIGKYDNSLNASDLLSYVDVYENPKRLEEIKKRQVGAGFQVSREYMPITNGCFVSMLAPVAIFFLAFIFSLVKNTGTVTFGQSIDSILSFLVFFIPSVLCLINKRTNYICPRCGHIHQMTSKFERFMGINKDFDPNETGCRECDYLPSRDRVITVE
jgi:hypothetical protein